MLARTDSRARALVLLIVVTLLATTIGARLVWWQVVEREWLAALALNQLAQSSTAFPPSEARSPTATASCWPPRSRFSRSSSRRRRSRILAWPRRCSRRPSTCRPPMCEPGSTTIGPGSGSSAASPPRSPTASGRSTSVASGLLPETKRVYPVAGAGVGDDARRAGPGLRRQRRRRVVRRGAGRGCHAGRDRRRRSAAQEDVAGRRIADSVTLLHRAGRWTRPAAHHRRRRPAPARAGDARHLRDNRAAGATGDDHERRDRRDPGHGQLPGLRREQVRHHRWRAVRQPGRLAAVRAGVGDEGVHHRRGARRRRRSPRATRSSTTTICRSATSASTTPTAVTIRTVTGRSPPARSSQLSNNVGAAKIGLTLGGDALYEAFRRFGFGTPTGIELTGEAERRGLAPGRPNASGDLTTAQNAFGQGLSMTAVQLVAGYAAFANGGNAGHAARRRGLDRSGRHLPRRRSSRRPNASCVPRRPPPWSSC